MCDDEAEELLQDNRRLRAINAELVAALEELIGYFPTSTTKPPVELLKQGRAAIARAQP